MGGDRRAASFGRRAFAAGLARLALAASLLVAGVALAAAADDKAQEQRGEALLKRHCSRCHAIGRTGESPHSQAPPFHTLSARYPIDSLQEALGEGIITGHPDMPEFKFEGPDVGAILAYLKSIQTR